MSPQLMESHLHVRLLNPAVNNLLLLDVVIPPGINCVETSDDVFWVMSSFCCCHVVQGLHSLGTSALGAPLGGGVLIRFRSQDDSKELI